MANSNAVWGIDIGQCALKALRCRPHEKDSGRIVAEAFDFIEYPKILSQPEADRGELIREALEQFLSRNEVKDDRVAISVPGQSGLARFIKLPPVETKKIPDIVKYEARQQIPFALEDVVWDYQPLIGAGEDEGYALETEVGLFAMKRDQVGRALKPLEDAGIDVDFVQLSPLAIYNYLCFDRLNNLQSLGSYDPQNPPPSTIVISLGTDTTDLVISNGFRVWQRNIPIGGNHFTKALTKELRLTFSKAEHLKRNATKAEDPKAVFQAMRPVFSDLVAEIQRSIGFFTSNNRQAKLGNVVALGNAMKLPGLQRYLSQNLDQEIKSVSEFSALVGGSATAAPQFKDNLLSFPVAYGLCVQALGMSQLRTNLLPEEIVTARLVRAKKPWTVAAAALLLVGIGINYASHYSSLRSADVSPNSAMAAAIHKSQRLANRTNGYASENAQLKEKFTAIVQIGKNLQSNVDGRLLWLESLKAIDAALPKAELPENEGEVELTAQDVMQRKELHIDSMECEHFDELGTWFAGVQQLYEESRQELPSSQQNPAQSTEAVDGQEESAGVAGGSNGAQDTTVGQATPETGMAADPYASNGFDDGFGEDPSGTAGGQNGPSGPGWVIQLTGHHFHNTDPQNESERFIRNTFFKNLQEGSLLLPDGPDGELIEVPIADLGIGYPVVVTKERIRERKYSPDAKSEQDLSRRRSSVYEESPRNGRPGQRNTEEEIDRPKVWTLRQYDFIVQFCWIPTPRSERIEQKSADQSGQESFDTAGLRGGAEPTL